VKFLFNDNTNPNTNPKTLTTLNLTQTDSGVAIGGSAGSRNRGPRPLGAPESESRETSNEHKS